nr:MAG TPA: hypothetical protein [Herelleviridae sp.]
MLLMLLGALGGLTVIGIIYVAVIRELIKAETKEENLFWGGTLFAITIFIIVSFININLARVLIGIVVLCLGILGIVLVIKYKDREDKIENILFSLGAIGFGIFELSHIVYLI